MPRVRGEREKDVGRMWYPPLGVRMVLPGLVRFVNFVCSKLLPTCRTQKVKSYKDNFILQFYSIRLLKNVINIC